MIDGRRTREGSGRGFEVTDQFEEVVVLPIALLCYGGVCVEGWGGSVDGLLGVDSRADCVSADVGGCGGLACGAGG